jgi:aminopeptidase YwaD
MIVAACAAPKKVVQPENPTLLNLKSHVSYLADDKLEGRRTGSNGEKLAMEYISRQFEKEGLLAKGEQGYYQSFEVYDGKKIDDSSFFAINGDALTLDKDYFPFAFSASAKMEALPSIAIQEADMPWFFDLKEPLEENSSNPHFDLAGYIRDNCKKAKARGASAIILYNTSGIEDKLAFDAKDRSDGPGIPVIYVRREIAKNYFRDSTASLNIKFNVSISELRRTGHNVIGYIDNGAQSTIILGAHYDHLGYGEDGNSRNTSKEPAIHNGADDNASGTAALIEMGRLLQSSDALHHNYLFIAFSGEELGLFGSKYFAEHPTIDLANVDYMINMDMVGRLNDSTKALTIGGYGTSPAWSTVIHPGAPDTKNIKAGDPALFIKIDSSGTGPSDHTSFYRKGIPVLFYFTGLHSDYHTPTDDVEKINFTGMLAVMENVKKVIEGLDAQPRIAFLKTRETTTTNRSFSVSLGIMPDYTFPGSGVRADGISEGKPAQKAGLRAGDIIVQLGDYQVTSMDSYMQALGKFIKGQSTVVKFKRDGQLMEAAVEF